MDALRSNSRDHYDEVASDGTADVLMIVADDPLYADLSRPRALRLVRGGAVNFSCCDGQICAHLTHLTLNL